MAARNPVCYRQDMSLSSIPAALQDILAKAVASGQLLEATRTNIETLLAHASDPINLASVTELADAGHWDELNDRFYRTIAFGTGGLRGKTIGRIITRAERGTPQALERPEHPCVGTSVMNVYNISRATQGLANYLNQWFAEQKLPGRPSVVISYDTRFFSREFSELIAKVLTEKGCDALVFESPRSTPELSFAVRLHNASAGINVTASHNPPEYNGYKVYFSDGAQVVEPHASGIIAEVDRVQSGAYEPLPPEKQGKRVTLSTETDAAYMDRLESLVLDPELIRKQKDLRMVYTPLHGVGAVIIKPMLARLGFQLSTVAEQEIPDGRFPTVKSPNPESAEALTMAMAQAETEGADIVLATDPDDDRMGVAARDASGTLQLLSGNQIGSLMAWYRAKRLFELGILNQENRARAVIIKTFVTTDLQKAIADKFGVPCVETLTGFKYIGAKLEKYELGIPEESRRDYRKLSEEETRALRLKYSSFYIFGGEESYGYSGSDFVRDKDGNAAVVMFAEVAAHAKSEGITVLQLLDRIYAEFGFYLERNESLTFEGAEGATKIRALIESFIGHPPTEINGRKVRHVRDFSRDDIHDVEGDLIPRESMLLLELEGGWKIAVRPSGTEPKIKFYLFGMEPPRTGDALPEVKKRVSDQLATLWGLASAGN